MMNFNNNDGTYNVNFNDEFQGYLEFNADQDAWVFWTTTVSGDEGITYEESLQETEDELTDDYVLA